MATRAPELPAQPEPGWRRARFAPSLAEVYRTVPVAEGSWWRKALAFAGPGYLVAVGYMDPGNWATDLGGGSRFGYSLLSVILLSNLMAILLQGLAAKLGIATGRDLAQACRDHYSKPVSLFLWVLCEIAIAACDLAEVIGSAIALNLLFGIPLTYGIVITALKPGIHVVTETLRAPDVIHALELTAVITVISVVVTALFGVVVAWVLVRQRFWGRALLNATVDLPFALSPVTVGLAALVLFGPGGWLASFFESRGIQIIFALPSMTLVTIFICVPFTIREIVPVLEEIGLDEEDASRTLGASVWQTFFRVTLPNIRWALAYGVALTTARAIGEIGAVLIVSGLLQGKTETATLFIFRAYEERQVPAAYVVALLLAAVSVTLLVVIEFLRHRQERERSRT